MTYELGRAQFILDVNSQDYIEEVAKVFNETTKEAQKAAKELAKANKVRVSDVKAAASIIIAEEKKTAAEQIKADKAAKDARLKLLKDTIANEVSELKKSEQEYKRVEAEKLKAARETSRQALEAERKTLREAEALRKQAAQQAKKDEADRIRAQRQVERDAAAKRKAGFFGQGGGGLGVGSFGGDAATLLGFGAIASGALVLRETIVKVTEATTKQEQAQRSLNAAFGQTQTLFKQTADAYAEQFGKVSSTVEQATSRFGVLNQQTNLTGEQIRGLTKGAFDLQAAFGGDLTEVFRSTAGAILGETEAFEKYGLVLQEGVLKSSDKLTASERARFSVMSESEKQMIRYRLIMEHLNTVQGTAAQKANETQGGFDKLTRAADEYAKTLGSTVIPEIGKFAGGLGGLITQLDASTKAYLEFRKSRDDVLASIAASRSQESRFGLGKSDTFGFGSQDTFSPENSLLGRLISELNPNSDLNRAIAARTQQRKETEEYAKEVSKRIALQKEEEDNAKKAANDRRAREEADNKATADRLKKQIQLAHDAQIAQIEEDKRLAEIEQRLKLEAIEENKKAELRRIEEIEYARKQAYEAEVARVQNEKNQKLKAIDDTRDAELERIEVEKDAAKAASEEQIRQLEIERDRRIKQADDTKDSELERLETEKEARTRAREIEDRELEDSVEKKERLLEDSHQRTLRRIEREKEALQDRYNKELRAIDEKEYKEEERHRKRMDELERENERELDNIDEQLKAFESAERQREAARRRRELNNRLADAQLELRKATGTGNAQDAEIARSKLVSAIRLGDPTAIKKAQDELAEIVGQGTEAIAKAQRELADVQQDIIDNTAKETEDAEKERLRNTQDRISKEENAEKRQEEERNRRRKKRLDDDKRAEKDKLDDALRKLEKKQEAEEDANRIAKRELDDLVKYNKRKLDDTRAIEDQAQRDSVEAVQNRHKKERDEIDETYNGEEHGYIPSIKRALEQTETNYDEQARVVRKRYEAEKEQITELYDNPETGIFAQLRKTEEESRRAYEKLVESTQLNFEAARKVVEKTYRADDGESGILDKFDRMKKDADKALDDVKLAFENSQKDLVGEGGIIKTTWEEATKQVNAYFDTIERRSRELAEERRRVTPRTQEPGTGDVPFGTGGGGMGTTPNPPGTTRSTGTPDPEQTSTAIPADNVAGLYSVAFGYGAKYSGNYEAGPGWEGGAAWPGGPSHHKGIDLIVPGARANGYGTPVPAFYGGRVLRTVPDSRGPGGNMVVISDDAGRTHWYLHLKDYTVSAGQTVRRGDIIAHMGDTGTEDFPHLHYEVRNGDNNGPMSLEALRRDGIDPNPFIRGRDRGYKFVNPTLTYDMRTGERNVLAEYGPELLLGRRDTQQLESMGVTRNTRRANMFGQDYMSVGSDMANAPTVTQYINTKGDTFTYNGVAPEDVMRQWREDQRRARVLRGRVNVTR